jgi:hypothetical protein
VSVEGIGNLTQTIEDLLLGQTNGTQTANAPGAGNPGSATVNEDTFTPSNQPNPATAAFRVSQGALIATGLNGLFAPATQSEQSSGRAAQPSSANTAKAENTQPAAATNFVTPVNPGQLFPPPPAEQSAAEKTAATANEQYQIQALNSQLPALGLTTEEIQEIDRIASQIQNFNPGAYITLVNQFESLANPLTQPSTANAAAGTNPGPSPKSTTNTSA